jgi:hypothetical protein
VAAVSSQGTSDPFHRTRVQGRNLFQQAQPVTVLEVQDGAETPVQVVAEVGDLLPQLVVRVVA